MVEIKISDRGLALIKEFEGVRLQSYQDVVGVWTIGYGHTGRDVGPGQTIDLTHAETLLLVDVARFETGVNKMVIAPLTQGQFDALLSFAYNLGLGNLAKSTLLRRVNAGDFTGAANEFPKWNKAGGKVLAGLTRRRRAEQALFRGG